MPTDIDLVKLADELAEIARTTRDAQTGERIMLVVERLLVSVGLSEDGQGGGELPSGWFAEPVFDRA